MEYQGMVIRPPSESNSLLLQVTLGCSHNKCTFCGTYRHKPFRIRAMEEIRRDIDECARRYRDYVQRVFLCDGDALVMKMDQLRETLDRIREKFPLCERVGSYATAADILRKSPEELAELGSLGLGILYLGLESGSDEILRRVKKGVNSEDMIEAVHRAKAAGIKTSVMVINGLGGLELWEEHARETVRVLNRTQPEYLAMLALSMEPGTELQGQIRRGEYRALSSRELLAEMQQIVAGLELNNCVFSSSHASNLVSLRGVLPWDKTRLLNEMEYYVTHIGITSHEEFDRT